MFLDLELYKMASCYHIVCKVLYFFTEHYISTTHLCHCVSSGLYIYFHCLKYSIMCKHYNSLMNFESIDTCPVSSFCFFSFAIMKSTGKYILYMSLGAYTIIS